MVEKISKHCWATPKCGITTAVKYFSSDKAVDFTFVIVRNPYLRIASFYISKIISHAERFGLDNNVPHIGDHSIDCTFEELISWITLGDRHLKLQSHNAEKYTHFVRLEYWAEDIKLVCDKLELDYDKYKSVGVNRSQTIDTITEYVGDKPTTWFLETGVPSDYSLFYNEQTKERVYELYKPDFDWLENVYDDLEIL